MSVLSVSHKKQFRNVLRIGVIWFFYLYLNLLLQSLQITNAFHIPFSIVHLNRNAHKTKHHSCWMKIWIKQHSRCLKDFQNVFKTELSRWLPLLELLVANFFIITLFNFVPEYFMRTFASSFHECVFVHRCCLNVNDTQSKSKMLMSTK